ncbi:MAG: molecular chaperone [Fluviicola sp.]|nr:molecular chaperone [Fluviicola sp.]
MKNKLFLIITLFIGVNAHSQSDLLITPFRVVFENGKNIEELTVANTGKDTARYTISFLQYKMLSTGKLEKIDAAEDSILFADKYLRIFPKTVTLAPNEAQMVRLQLKTPPDLAPGEYRSHLYFRSIVDETPDMGTETDSTGIGFKLVPVYGITIPVILRMGQSVVKANASDIQVTDVNGLKQVDCKIERYGNVSTFGQLEVEHTSETGAKTILGKVNGVAVYTPIHSRDISVPLSIPETVDLTKGKIALKYYSKVDGKEVYYFDQPISL